MTQEIAETDTIREIARFVLDSTSKLQDRLLDENSAAFRWLMASLLAINGGAALGIMSSNIVARVGIVYAGSSFTVGTVFAILLGLVTARSAEKAFEPIASMNEFWLNVALSGQFDEVELKAKMKSLESRVSPSKLASYLTGFLSLGFFLLGVVITGHSLK